MNISPNIAGAVLALAFPASASADLAGKVITVHDGDTLTVVLADERQVKIRLAEIDAPELRQPFGQRSREALADLCLGKDAVVRETGRGRGGMLAHVSCAGTDANAEQVRSGMAWVYRRGNRSASPLYFLEDAAQRAH